MRVNRFLFEIYQPLENEMQFVKATRKKARLRLALTGPSGSGKTMAALMIAKGLGGRVAVLDTEHGSASLYADPINLPNGLRFEPPAFDALELTAPYSPERYIEAIKAAQAAGYDTLIIDSLTHEWSGSGGCLEINDTVAAAKFRGNSWSAWNETTPRHRAFIDAMLQSSMHIIATGRSKTETAQTEGANGRKQVVKLGMKTEQRDGIEYEFTVVLDLIHAGHYANASKDRTGLFAGGEPAPIDAYTGARLLAWLETGTEGPDLTAILAAIAGAQNMEALRGHYEAAITMLPEAEHGAIKKAKTIRYRELAPKPETA
jgi:hypothetical protein